jgi:alpha-beta hydrolase superfamily lysophospholipase
VRGGHAQYPEPRHFIIAHSHGGIVALYALRDPAADQVVSGIITLATPFVSARPRRFRPFIGAMTFLLIAGPVVAGALLLKAMWPLRPVLLAWVLGGVFLTATADRRCPPLAV